MRCEVGDGVVKICKAASRQDDGKTFHEMWGDSEECVQEGWGTVRKGDLGGHNPAVLATLSLH